MTGVSNRPMTDHEAVEMMERCKQEILTLRATIDRLAPKAEAYDNMVIILAQFPRPSQGAGEDLVWALNKRIESLKRGQETKP